MDQKQVLLFGGVTKGMWSANLLLLSTASL